MGVSLCVFSGFPTPSHHRCRRSSNGVLLCEGPVPVQFVRRITEDKLKMLRAEAGGGSWGDDGGSSLATG